jgi:hypothetical protein
VIQIGSFKCLAVFFTKSKTKVILLQKNWVYIGEEYDIGKNLTAIISTIYTYEMKVLNLAMGSFTFTQPELDWYDFLKCSGFGTREN